MMKKYVFFLLLAATVLTAGEPIGLLAENPHYFTFRGQPTVLITSGEHYGAVLNQVFDQDVYLSTLAADGLNLTRLFSGAYVEKPGAFGIVNNTLAPAEGQFLPPWARSDQPGYINGGAKFDLDQFNPAYFERLKTFLKKADEKGIVVELVLFSSIYTEDNWRYMPFHPANNVNNTEFADFKKVNTLENGRLFSYQEKLVRHIVREVNAFDNLYFEIQNEPWSDRADSAGVILEHLNDDAFAQPGAQWQNRLDLADEASLAWQKKIAEIIVDEEKNLPNKHLIAQNYVNFIYPLPRVESEISILNFHYALPQTVALNYAYNRPLSFDETGFAGSSPDVYRRQAWRFILSGGAAFSGLDYSFYPGFENGTGELNGPGGGGPELRRELGVLRKFIESFNLSELTPDGSTINHAPGIFSYLLSCPGKQYAGYFEGRGPSTLRLNLPAGDYTALWIDAKTGNVISRTQVHSSENDDVILMTPVFSGEIALELRRK